MSRKHYFSGNLRRTLMLISLFLLHSPGWAETRSSVRFFEAPFSARIQAFKEKKSRIQAAPDFKEMYQGNVLSFSESIDRTPIKFFLNDKKIWLLIQIEVQPENQSFLEDLLQSICTRYDLPAPGNGRFTNRVTIPIRNSDGTINVAGMLLPKLVVQPHFKIISREKIGAVWQVDPRQVQLVVENGQVYWKFEHGRKQLKTQALFREGVSKKLPAKTSHGLIPFLFFVLPFAEIKLNRKETFKYMFLLIILGLSAFFPYMVHSAPRHYAIVYPQNLNGWDAVLSAAHTKYPNFTDITFADFLSEKVADLKTAQPDGVLLIAPPEIFTPTFLDDADQALCELDDDKFVDVTWTIISGYTAIDAMNLLNAPLNTNSHTLIIANPDGSLLSSGFAGNYLAHVQTDDDTHLGAADYFINDTDVANANASAQLLSQEINADAKDCVFFLGHGNPSTWGLAQGFFSGSGSQLRTYNNGTFYSVNNSQNSLVDAEACLTLRIHNHRDSQWKPWEEMSSNMTASATSSIALAWMKNSNGFYIGNISVSYGNTHVMLVLLNMLKFGYPPAETIKFMKNIYLYIIDAETTDNDLSDGDGNDYLLYAARELAGLGAPDWNIDLAGNAPDYGISYTHKTQQDLWPTNSRGLVYTGQSPKWRCTTTLSVNEEIWVEMDGAAEDESPFTFIPVENLFADTTGGYIGYDDVTAVIGGIFKPTPDTRQMGLVSSNPSDALKLYTHNWYGAGDSRAIETFKCQINNNEIVWLLAAGVTDAGDDGTYEWRINQGYSQSFDVFYWLPAVTQHVGQAIKIDDKTWKRSVSVTNPGSQNVAEVIVNIQVPNETQTLQLTPAAGTHDWVLVTERNLTFAEFTVSTLNAGETKAFELQYRLDAVSAQQKILADHFRYAFLFETDTLAVITFSNRGSVDSVRVTAYPDSFPQNSPGAPDQMPVKRFLKLNPFDGTGFTASVCLYYTQAEFDASDIFDETGLHAAFWDDNQWQPQITRANPARNIVCFETSVFSTWGIGGPNGSLPVELAAFSATAGSGKIRLAWSTASEFQNLGFELFRSETEPGNWQQIASFSENPNLRGAGTVSRMNHYSFEDAEVQSAKTYWYQLKDVNFSGQKQDHPAISVTVEAVLPEEHGLNQNFPNPFNAVTQIRFAVSKHAPNQPVKLIIFDVTGRIVKTVINQVYEPGWHSVIWNGQNEQNGVVASGVYFYQLQIGEFRSVKKLILMY